MTPAARVQAAIEVLDAIQSGLAAEQALSRWARGARYAGSKDRAAVRDHVFAVLRRKRSVAALGGGETGRALMLGLMRDEGVEPQTLFTGETHAPAGLGDAERSGGRPPSEAERRDLPDWLWARFVDSLGEAQAEATAEALRYRAPICLRLNKRHKNALQVIDILKKDGIEVAPVPDVIGALLVTEGARRVAQSQAYAEGLVELQDASSQAAMARLEVPPGGRVLDYCAGGGGKVLALAARHEAQWFAHDAAPQRMGDLPARAARAGVQVQLAATRELPQLGPFDLILCDVPCSGSGTWRRTPEAKWALTPERLDALCTIQREILLEARALLRPGGVLAFSTCSVLQAENEHQVEWFVGQSSGCDMRYHTRWPVCETGDGFYMAEIVCH